MQHFRFISFTLLALSCLLGCSAQSKHPTNVVQSEAAKPSQSPSPNPNEQNTTAKEIDLKISGVGIGTSESIALKKLGRPLQTQKGEFDECGGGFQKTLRYSGLEVELLSNDKGQDFSVISIDVTSSEWFVASKLRVGLDVKDVETEFGLPFSKEEQDGQIISYYLIKGHDGWANLFFRDNKLSRIRWILTYC